MTIEPLESRIAPASVLTFTDVDGDKVTITSSLGNLAGKAVFAALGAGSQLRELTLTAAEFAGANISIVSTKSGAGDGLLDVGFINATNRDIGKVSVDGDLGRILAGDGNSTVAALAGLTVRSLGRQGFGTQAAGGSLDSAIGSGTNGAVKILGDVRDAHFTVTGSIASLTIGGSLIGSALNQSGQIQVSGSAGVVKIGRDVVGGAGTSSGLISAGSFTSITIGGSLLGGVGGSLVASGIRGGGDVFTDSIGGSASIFSKRIGSLTIGGSIVAGPTAAPSAWSSIARRSA